MKCETFLNAIDDFVESTLAPSEHKKFEAHLKLCAGCREELKSLQSLLDRADSLPKIVTPGRDLWPEIAAGITAAGPPQRYPSQVTTFGSKEHSLHSPVAKRWVWRLAAVAVLGTMFVLAATYLRSRAPLSNEKNSVAPSGHGTREDRSQSQSVTEAQLSEQQRRFNQGPTGQRQDDRGAADYIQACQCGPSDETLGLIDNAWIVDENLPSLQARKVVSDRLYNLAVENTDNFFLHKAALEARSYPVITMVAALTDRYRMTLGQHPEDPALTYLYAYSLLGTDTPQMIRLMRQLAAEHPEFPWPNLALAEVRGLFSYKDEKEAQSYLQAFVKLCPDSPEPTRVLVAFDNSDFLAGVVRRMRINLAARSDTQALMLYDNLWYLEALRGASGEEPAKVRQAIKNDLERLQSLDDERQRQLATVIRSGYAYIGDKETFRDLIEKDPSESGRWGSVMLEIQEWNGQHPTPPDGTPAEKQVSYWESRLQMSESWIKKLPEDPSIWVIRLEALAKLKNRPQSEFLEVAKRALELEQVGPETPELTTHVPWQSNLLKLASLCAERRVLLEQVPGIINEGLSAYEKHIRDNASDLSRDPHWSLLMARFRGWLEADDAWHSLASAFVRVGNPSRARQALDCIDPGLAEFKSQLAQVLAGTRGNEDVITVGQRQSMANELTVREKRLATARASIAVDVKKQ